MCTMMDISEVHTTWVVLVVAIVSVVYTSLGGLRAVVVTDCMQTVLLFGGALLVLLTITVRMDGFSWFPAQWDSTALNLVNFSIIGHGILSR